MSYRAITGPSVAALGLSVATLMLAGAPEYTQAESTNQTPSATDKMEQKPEQLGSKLRSTTSS